MLDHKNKISGFQVRIEKCCKDINYVCATKFMKLIIVQERKQLIILKIIDAQSFSNSVEGGIRGSKKI